MAAEPFAQSCCKKSVAQICQLVGIKETTDTFISTFADVLTKYIEEMGHRVKEYTEHSGRTESNVIDMCRVFSEMGIELEDLLIYLERVSHLGTPIEIPNFPCQVENPIIFSNDPTRKGSHIPSFLPPLPEIHTFKSSKIIQDVEKEIGNDHEQRIKRKREVEESLSSLSNLLKEHPVNSYDAKIYSTSGPTNPFLQPTKVIEAKYVSGCENGSITVVSPTPLKPTDQRVTNAYYAKEVNRIRQDDRRQLSEKQKQQARVEDTGERGKRKAKCERILSLKHTKGLDILETEQAMAKRSPNPSPSVFTF